MKSRRSLEALALLALLLLLSSSQAQGQDIQCRTSGKADIVLLVDGSWSVGRFNFRIIRNFIADIVSPFNIGPDNVQIALSQYSGDTRTEWHLNSHPTKESLLQAVNGLPFKGGNTMTGLALRFILGNNFQPGVGMRPDARKIAVLITDGKSQDEVVFSSQSLRDSGVELYAVGVKQADNKELELIASDPDEVHMYHVRDFSFLADIVHSLRVNLCNSVKGSDTELAPPTNLVTSEVTHHSFRVSWTAPELPVKMYRVTYAEVAGGPTMELLVDGNVTTTVLENLSSLTEYVVNVYAVVDEVSSEPLKGTQTTLPAPKNLSVSDETSSSMKVSWEVEDGATEYLLLYRSINGSEPRLDKVVSVAGDVTETQLVELTPNTEYSILLLALQDETPMVTKKGRGLTRPVWGKQTHKRIIT
ncbi:collagen alpha-1(XII) chain-like [Fundulus diaphanus]